MGLIKSHSAPAAIRAFSLRDVEEHARMIIERARKQADALLAEAQREADRLHDRSFCDGSDAGRAAGHDVGFQAGVIEGKAAGLEEQRQQLATLTATMNAVLSQIEAERAKLAADASADLIRLALAIARKVCHRYGESAPASAIANVQHAAARVVAADDLRIAIHPSQQQAMEEALPALVMQLPMLEHVRIVEDATVSPGGCRVHTAGGLIDADLDQQIDLISAELLADPSTTGLMPTAPNGGATVGGAQ